MAETTAKASKKTAKKLVDAAPTVAAVDSHPLSAVGIDAICQMILDGVMITQIAEKLGVGKATLLSWIAADTDRSARAREARSLSAVLYEEKAQRGIEEACDMFELSKAKEMAHHFRWKAAKINPRDYGEKQQIELNDVTPRTQDQVDTELAKLVAKASANGKR